jgi:hypothetical protein
MNYAAQRPIAQEISKQSSRTLQVSAVPIKLFQVTLYTYNGQAQHQRTNALAYAIHLH